MSVKHIVLIVGIAAVTIIVGQAITTLVEQVAVQQVRASNAEAQVKHLQDKLTEVCSDIDEDAEVATEVCSTP